MQAIEQADARLTHLCARRDRMTRGDFWRLVDILLDERNDSTHGSDTHTDRR